jgi:hypothetical protein
MVKKEDNKTTPLSKEATAEKNHLLSHRIYDHVSDDIHDFIGQAISSNIESNEDVDEDDRFEYVIGPIMAAVVSAVADYGYHIGYSKGDLLEMICDFYNQSEEFDTDEECTDPTHNHGPTVVDKKDIN